MTTIKTATRTAAHSRRSHHEYQVYHRKGRAQGAGTEDSDRKQTTIWNFDKPKRNANHPISKPLDLLGYPIGNSTQENGVVIDTFGGSGSTLMACEQMKRICYMMELDEKYASVILRRYVEDTGNADGVFVTRGGKQIPYADLVKEVETKDKANSAE